MSAHSDLESGAVIGGQSPAAPAPSAASQPERTRSILGVAAQQILLLPWIGVLIGIIVIGAYVSFTAPCSGGALGMSCFLTSDNLLTLAQEFSYVGIAALGGAMVIMTKGIDLSVGANMALTGLITTEALNRGVPAAVAILIGIGLGLAVGLINAFFITGVGLQPFIATLGMLSVVRGAALARSQGTTLYPPQSFTIYGQGKVGPVPNQVVVMLVLAVILTVFLNYTRLGRHIYAVGGNENAARLLGIKTNWVKVFVYAAAGILAAIAGILLTSFLGSGAPNAADGYELDVIAAAVIGGVSLFGGEGTLFGVLLGAALIEEIRNALDLEGVPGYWTQFVIGAVILLAMTIDQLRRRLRRA
jgi:ribose transport system permease protein